MPTSLADRFMRHVKPGPGDCIDWTGSVDAFGYGMIRIGPSKIERSHRVALRESGVSVSTNDIVMHSCDRPCCVNPRHLSIGTITANNEDRDVKGRHIKFVGEAHPRARLNREDILVIRSSQESHANLARHYAVTPAHIGNIRARRIWKHL